jgi:3-oxoacyl-[acyl-carrier-protein] synthase II
VITGAGIITALGCGWKDNALGFRLGRVALRPVSLFDVSRQRAKVAGEVDLPARALHTQLPAREEARLDRAARLLLYAAKEAWVRAGWEPSENLPVVLGTTSGGMTLGQELYRQAIQTPHRHWHQPTRVIHYQPQRQALALLAAFGSSGPITIIANACASGANAIGHAWELLRLGRANRVFTGGYEALSQLLFVGFDSLQALSPTSCRPFDAHRDGLALGEGAAMLALETLEHASKRGATILGEVIGYGATTDAHHLTQPHPNGQAALGSMNAACASAQINPAEIDYLNAHGTGTPLNDSAEAAAINSWAGSSSGAIRVSSTKSGIGHLLGAAGAVEAVVCLMSLREQWLPPTSTIETPEPSCAFPIVRCATEARVNTTMTNSFGFGGANASLILRKWS